MNPRLVMAIVALSWAAPLIRWAAPAPALSIAALRVSMAALMIAAIAFFTRGPSAVRLQPAQRARVALAGVLLGVHFALWIASLSYTSVAASVSLVATNPVFAALLGRFAGDRVGAREWLGISIAVVGCAVLAGGDWQAGGTALVGDLLALAGAACAAAYLVVGRQVGSALPLWRYLAWVNASAALTLLVIAGVAGAPLFGLPAHSYLAIAASAVVASVIGHTLLNAAVRTTPTHLVALAILGEPVGSTLIAWALFAEVPPTWAVVGALIALVGIAVGFMRRVDHGASPRRGEQG